MRDSLAVEIGDASQDLFETALHFAWGHTTFLDGGIEISSGTELHDLTPFHVFILNEVDGLHDIDMMKCGRNAELGCKLFDIFFLRFVLPTFAELFDSIEPLF